MKYKSTRFISRKILLVSFSALLVLYFVLSPKVKASNLVTDLSIFNQNLGTPSSGAVIGSGTVFQIQFNYDQTNNPTFTIGFYSQDNWQTFNPEFTWDDLEQLGIATSSCGGGSCIFESEVPPLNMIVSSFGGSVFRDGVVDFAVLVTPAVGDPEIYSTTSDGSSLIIDRTPAEPILLPTQGTPPGPAPSYSSTKTWNFETLSDYVFDNSQVDLSGGVARLNSSLLTEQSHWEKSPNNPFLTPTQAWEETLVFEPSVLYENGTFKMWYSGAGNTCSVGYATSTDGINWTKPFNDPIVGQGNGGVSGIACRSSVTKVGSTYYLTYVDGTGGGGEDVYVVTSTDGITFSNPTLILSNSGWEMGIANTFLLVDNGTWYLFYEARTNANGAFWQIGLASGPDLSSLTRVGTGPLTSLRRGGVYGGPAVYKIGSEYHMWYHASFNGSTTPTYVVHSVSNDLVNWTNFDNSQVVPITQSTWEVDQTADPVLVEANGKTYLYYSGNDNSGSSVVASNGMVEFNGTLQDLAALNTRQSNGAVSPVITPVLSTAQDFDFIWSLSETSTLVSGRAYPKYQVSIDGGSTWKYWNGVAWASVIGDHQSSHISTINNNIRSLANTGNGGTFLLKAFLYSEGGQIALDDVSVSYSLLTAPVLNRAESNNPEKVTLEWSASTQATAPITDYVVEYKKSSANTWTVFPHDASTGTTIVISNLESGQSYDFRIAAVNSQSVSDYSNIRSTQISSHGAVILPATSNASPTQTPVLPSSAVQTTQPVPGNPSLPEGVCTPYMTGVIKQGSADPILVRKLQEFLNQYEQAGLEVDGTYDTNDISAVKKFQEKYRTEILAPWGLRSGTGIVSLTTISKINSLVCGKNIGCPHFSEYVKAGETKPQVGKIKEFLNMIDSTLNLDSSNQTADPAFVAAVNKFQLRYRDFILKPWGLTRPTGYWYKTTSAKANEFMGCVQ